MPNVRLMRSGEENKICSLIKDVFNEFVASEYSSDGCMEFIKYVRPDQLLRRTRDKQHFVLVAEVDERVVGTIEFRSFEHISLLFVDGSHQRQGIAKTLFNHALAICRENNPKFAKVTVNSSPNAVVAYKKLDFLRLTWNRNKMVYGMYQWYIVCKQGLKIKNRQ